MIMTLSNFAVLCSVVHCNIYLFQCVVWMQSTINCSTTQWYAMNYITSSSNTIPIQIQCQLWCSKLFHVKIQYNTIYCNPISCNNIKYNNHNKHNNELHFYYNANNNHKECDIVPENTGYNVASYGVLWYVMRKFNTKQYNTLLCNAMQ